ncbi:hypothetical protein DRN75_00570 [Nanoarchaeota archaeon]|nr:MAG: hypothetical protein DRN75_00570 [Nanoarchaeota archaeon]
MELTERMENGRRIAVWEDKFLDYPNHAGMSFLSLPVPLGIPLDPVVMTDSLQVSDVIRSNIGDLPYSVRIYKDLDHIDRKRIDLNIGNLRQHVVISNFNIASSIEQDGRYLSYQKVDPKPRLPKTIVNKYGKPKLAIKKSFFNAGDPPSLIYNELFPYFNLDELKHTEGSILELGYQDKGSSVLNRWVKVGSMKTLNRNIKFEVSEVIGAGEIKRVLNLKG